MTRPLRILFITRKYPPSVGGMEQFSYHLTTKISCEKRVIALKGSYPRILLPFFILYAGLAALFSAGKYDMIHLGDGVLFWIAWFVKKFRPRAKVAVTLHGLDVTYPTPLYSLYKRFFARSCDLYICISAATERLARNDGLHPTVVIPVGVETSAWKGTFQRSDLLKYLGTPTENRFVCLTTGRLVQRKGVPWFVKNVLPQLPSGILYLIAGDGPCRKEIQDAIGHLHGDARVQLLGKVPQHVLKMLYHTADLFIMPNIRVAGDAEGFGIVALEAGACGLPTLAADCEGVRDAVTLGQTGWFVESENTEAFIQAISDKALHPEHLLRREDVQRSVAEHFDWNVIISQYEHEFEKLSRIATVHS